MQHSSLFQPFELGSLTLKNRCVLAPMTRVSANEEGSVSAQMLPYYKSFAQGGFAALITEGVYTDRAYSQCYRYQPGLTDGLQAASWKPLIEQVQDAGAAVIMQLMHAGALSQYNRFSTLTGGPSSIRPKGTQMEFYRGHGLYELPSQMSSADIETAISGFVEAAQRAEETGVSGVEIHGANGYLLDQFLTDYANHREDQYGGSVGNRIRLTCEILGRVREKVSPEFVVGVRISQSKVNDFEHKWAGGEEDARVVFTSLKEAGASYIHTTEFEADKPAFGTGASLAQLARQFSNLPVIANGGLGKPDRAAAMLESSQADLIALGKPALASNAWPNQVRANGPLKEFNFEMFSPRADLESESKWKEKETAQ
ncbi:NADH:flavin oxidoreductase [Flexibacterium corallicola]|uniref:NADH:flavin oxidoreductase n=1 Tax=Flexibacterium corallicola TaxID=3037259 RepID=UPI00286FAEBD|nr:NADH:flavin oxidoreductase [Pseudovibrio sp. M1P-2-3]